MTAKFKKISDMIWFRVFIIVAIIILGINVGLQTNPVFYAEHKVVMDWINDIILALFIFEFFIKLGCELPRPHRYFYDPWNVFDFVVIAVSLWPNFDSDFVIVMRLIRLLKILKLFTALPRLNLIIGTVLRSIPSMGYVFFLLFIHFYIYAVMATFLFSQNDPVHFGNLQTSLLSLFRAVTLEDWTDLMYINMYGSDVYGYTAKADMHLLEAGIERLSHARPVGAAVFFVSFILTGSMIMLNLVIGVIMTGMEEMKREREIEDLAKKQVVDHISLKDEIHLIDVELQQTRKNFLALAQRLKMYEYQKDAPENE